MTSDAERWNHRWQAVSDPVGLAHPMVCALALALPKGARVLDVAAGRGRQTRPLLEAGHRVTAVDVSAVGLALIDAVDQHELRTVVADLTMPLPAALKGPFDAIVCIDYRAPALWAGLRTRLEVGGHLLVSLATVVNLERHARPSRRFLAEEGEQETILGPLEPVQSSAGWRDSGRHELWVWGQRPARMA
ncbi:MAG TPA: class I SAM-dependent methyltransferase [Deltaproteobacteria bacterium]|nr:class I SAM-dependent methyltransferase [Deltaproteobacteria bacterium]